MQVLVNRFIIEKTKGFRLGILSATVDECTDSNDELKQLISTEEENIRTRFALDTINKHPIITSTRTAYKQMGCDPNRYRPSADSLLRRIVKGNSLYSIHTVVDVLNLISIKTGYSIGGYDANKIDGIPNMGIGKYGETYIGIGRGSMNIENLPVLRDKLGAFGTPTSDSERTSITTTTNKVLFIFYDFGRHQDLEAALLQTIELLKKFVTNVEITHEILNF